MNQVAAVITSKIERRHRWIDGEQRRIPACEAPDGNNRTEKICPLCNLTKITVHDGNGRHWLAWRTKGGLEFPDNGKTPLCEGGE